MPLPSRLGLALAVLYCMGAVLSPYAAAVDAAKNYAQQRGLISSSDADDYWSGLPDDLLFTIMAALDIPDLRRAGAVCTSWRDAHNAFPLPALEQAPCLLYACEEYGPNDAALYCPSTDATFRVPFPGPPHEKRGFAFSCSNGWVFTTDEVGDPYLLNPVTGAQATLPPVSTIHHYDDDDESFYDDDGKHLWDDIEGERPSLSWARHTKYHRVVVDSAAAKVTECTVLIVHAPFRSLSYASPGDEQWKLLLPVSDYTSKVEDILYNDKDGLFYILNTSGSVSTLDLSGPSPLVTTIMRDVTSSGRLQTMYLALGPSGQLLQVWRNWDLTNTPLKYRATHQRILNSIHQDCIDLASGDEQRDKLSGLETNHDDEEDEFYEPDDTDDQEIDVSELLREGIDVPHRLVHEVTTLNLLIFKVDTDRQKLVELTDLGDHALFLGLNSVVCLSTKEFPVFEPNCAYLTDDCSVYRPMFRKDLGIWNINNRSMQKLGDAWPNLYPWLHLPAPLWITPKF